MKGLFEMLAKEALIKDAALRLVLAHGISVIPLQDTGKRPIEAWSQFQDRLASWGEIVTDWPAGCNMGIVTGKLSRLVVVDCESIEDAVWFWTNRGQTTCVAETPRGVHFYFRHPGAEHVVGNAQRVADEHGTPRYDIRGDGGFVVAPPSNVEASDEVKKTGVYRWRAGKELRSVDELPVFNSAWCPPSSRDGQQTRAGKVISDGAAYIAKIRAVSGQGGHKETFRAAASLRDSGLSECEALATLIEWNGTNADPPWSLSELLHKVQDVYRKG